MSGSGITWAICKSAPNSRQITMPTPRHSFYRPDALPAAQPTASKHWRQWTANELLMFCHEVKSICILVWHDLANNYKDHRRKPMYFITSLVSHEISSFPVWSSSFSSWTDRTGLWVQTWHVQRILYDHGAQSHQVFGEQDPQTLPEEHTSTAHLSELLFT